MVYKSYFNEVLIEDNKEEQIINYKYKGSDLSLIYKYINSPIARFLVNNIIPSYIAFFK